MSSHGSNWKEFLAPRAIVMARRRSIQEPVQDPGISISGAPRALVEPEASLEPGALVETPQIVEPGAARQDPQATVGQSTRGSLSSLEQIAQALDDCRRCKLCQKRKTVVVGEGNPHAELVFVGEGPGEQEDLEGRPFVGKAGQLLDKMIQAIGLQRQNVYIANVVKCLRYNTMVQLENGSWERIGRIVRSRYSGRVMSVMPDGTLIPKRVIGWHTSPLAGRQVLKLTYASSALRGKNKATTYLTHDHEVLTQRGWVQAGQLKSDDKISIGQGLSDLAYDIVLGSLLGDGTISKKNAHLALGHSRDQQEYVQWKAKGLKELSPIVFDGVATAKKGGPQHLTTRCRTRATRGLRVIRNQFYSPSGDKIIPREFKLTERILAIWFLDDGYISIRPNRVPLAEIAAHSFDAQNIELLIEHLQKDLGITGYVRESSPGRIYFDKKATLQLSESIAPFCPPCMRYKLDPEVEKKIPFDPIQFEPGQPKALYDQVVVERVDFQGSDRTFYCIDVEDTHCFVTSGGIVHNCRPPGNRNPEPDEMEACSPFLIRQLELIRPRVIVALGKFAAQTLLRSEVRITQVRGKFQIYRTPRVSSISEGIKLMPTFHPSYLLRNPAAKRESWADLQLVAKELGLEIPRRG